MLGQSREKEKRKEDENSLLSSKDRHCHFSLCLRRFSTICTIHSHLLSARHSKKLSLSSACKYPLGEFSMLLLPEFWVPSSGLWRIRLTFEIKPSTSFDPGGDSTIPWAPTYGTGKDIQRLHAENWAFPLFFLSFLPSWVALILSCALYYRVLLMEWMKILKIEVEIFDDNFALILFHLL